MNASINQKSTPQHILKSEHGFTYAELFKGEKYKNDDVYLVRKDGYRGSVTIANNTVNHIYKCITLSKEKIKNVTKIHCNQLHTALHKHTS